MKEILCRVKSFIIFDSPLRNDYIRELFTNIHASYQKVYPHWSLNATRKKVISEFWFRQVLFHYSVILIFGIIAVIPFGVDWHCLLLSVILSGSISFFTLTAFNYWPLYYAYFLPQLDTIMAEQEKRIGDLDQMKKCKRSQFSIPTLTVIFYVFSKTSNISLPACNDRSAELLNNLYGADKDKLKQNLSRLYKLSHLSPKERAEIQKGIDNARTFFQTLDHPPAEQILDQLELKLQGPDLFSEVFRKL
jgi:hypothetical protein